VFVLVPTFFFVKLQLALYIVRLVSLFPLIRGLYIGTWWVDLPGVCMRAPMEVFLGRLEFLFVASRCLVLGTCPFLYRRVDVDTRWVYICF